MGVDHEAGFVESLLALTQTLERIVDLGFQTFEVFESDVEEVAGAAGRIEDFDGTKPPAELGEYGDRFAGLTGPIQSEGGGLHVAPVLAERFDHGGDDQAFHVGAWGVVRAEEWRSRSSRACSSRVPKIAGLPWYSSTEKGR